MSIPSPISKKSAPPCLDVKMGDDEWDLHAVVRSCTAVVNSAAVDRIDDPFLNLVSLDSGNDYTSFNIFPDFAENQSCKFDGLLEEIYNEFCAPPHQIPSTALIPSVPEEIQILPPPPSQKVSPSFPATNSRSRKRKSQPKKMVKQMTQEELTDDFWAWRKYGQKPIKGSPYPRNYYRCSTSKICGARRQVERNPSDPSIFVVSYTGDHTHPRPTHRSSLAGSSRTKFPASVDKLVPLSAAPVVSKPSFSSSSPASLSSFSPTTPLAEDESGVLDDDDVLIPNVFLTEDIFKGFQELSGGLAGFGGGGGGATPNLLSPPWSPTSSATTSFTGRGGAC